MKRFIVSMLLVGAILIAPLAVLCTAKIADSSMRHANELFVAVACMDAEGIHPEGSAFPVEKHLLMTAGHINCREDYEGSVTLVTLDAGKHWTSILDSDQWRHAAWDAQIMYAPTMSFEHVAGFREPSIGDEVAGRGIIHMAGELPVWDGIFTKGYVVRITNERVFSTNSIGGGLSGSPQVAADNKVIGMVVESWPAYNGHGVPSAWFTAAIPGQILKDLLHKFQVNVSYKHP